MSDQEKPAPLPYQSAEVRSAAARPTTNQALGTALATVALLVFGGFAVMLALLFVIALLLFYAF